MKKHSRLNSVKVLAVLFIIILSTTLYLWIYFASDIDNIGFNNEKVKSLSGDFAVTCISDSGESTMVTTLPARFEAAKAGDKIIIKYTLSSDEIKAKYLAFYRQQTWADVYLDDVQVIQTDRTPKLPFPMSAGSHWYIFKLPDDYNGKELSIELSAQFDKYAPILPEIFSGSKSSIIYMILHNARFSIMTGAPTITLGIFCILLGLLFCKKSGQSRRMLLLGLLAVIISCWYLLESRISQVLFGNTALFSFVLFACYYLIPLLVISLLLTYETFNRHKFTHVLFWLAFASFLLVQILQIAGIAYYIEMVFFVHSLLILIILNIIISYIHEKRSKKPTDEIYIYKAFMIFCAFALCDLIGFYISPTYRVGTMSEVGLLFFCVYLIYTVFKEFYETEIDIAKNEIYHELAVKDLMTGLANRTAFEQEMTLLRKNQIQPESIHFLFADVNNMKSINDTYGHANGDDCLINTAQILMKCFAEPSTCYRIGGDEFCVICRGLTDAEIDERIEELHKLVKSKDAETVYPYAIACGYHIIDEDGTDACFKKADAMMYQDKERIKSLYP